MIVGIDLGTTNSLVAYYDEDGTAKVIPNRLGKLLTPSVVAVDNNDNVLIGETAREFGYFNPDCVVKVFKRTMGTDSKYILNGHEFLSEELSSLVLRSLKEDAEVYLNTTVDEAVISVPAYFNDNQRKATKKAGELAGLNVSRIISEPTASAIAYGIGDDNKMERCMVFDLGGGTFDVSILEYFRNIMEVHSIAGDNNLGGEDFTLALMQMFLQREQITELDLTIYELNNLYKEAERAKCAIGKDGLIKMTVKIDGIACSEEFTLAEYEAALEPLLDRLRKPIEKSIRDAKLTVDDLDRVILVGGATRLPIIREFVFKVMGIYPNHYVNPDTSVAVGAALQSAMKKRNKNIEEIILTDVCPFTLGTEVVRFNGMFDEPGHYLAIIERNTVIPVSKKQRVYTAHDNQKQVTVDVLQGESRVAANNLKLGEITCEVPVGPKGQEAIDITYTYDVNSLLEVIVEVVSTKETKRIIIQNQKDKMSEEEAEARLKRLQYLKQNPREEEENYHALLRGNRVFEESTGRDKDIVEQALFNFEKIMSTGTRLEIERTRKRLVQLLDEIENQNDDILLS